MRDIDNKIKPGDVILNLCKCPNNIIRMQARMNNISGS